MFLQKLLQDAIYRYLTLQESEKEALNTTQEDLETVEQHDETDSSPLMVSHL